MQEPALGTMTPKKACGAEYENKSQEGRKTENRHERQTDRREKEVNICG